MIYLGSSLPRQEAECILDGDYRPPIRRGDLSTCNDARTIVIIDGEFGQNLPVSPKEILRRLDEGTQVIGAASMGALRAAELHSCGMQGCGWVFEAYFSGRITRDDEVAVMYSPIDFTPLTIALVNIRYAVRKLSNGGILEHSKASRILRISERIFFADRTPNRLRRELRSLVSADVLEELTEATLFGQSDIKAADVRLALTQVACSYGGN